MAMKVVETPVGCTATNMARHDAAAVRSVLNRHSARVSPGQWALVEDMMQRVYRDRNGEEAAVADYV